MEVVDAVGPVIASSLASGWQAQEQGPGHLQAHKALADGEDVSLDVYRYDKADPDTGAEIGVHIRLGAR